MSIFFQDYEENMKIFSPKYLKWNLESTALKLHAQFKDSCVFVIKPSKMIQQSLSIYKNFLEFNSSGNPVFSSDSGCILQCYQLCNNAILAAINDSTNNNVYNSHVYDTPLTLMGFSKGCVVLNQFVYEIKHSKFQENTNAFLSKLSAIYWLDSGHNGKGNVWITEDESLKELAELRVKIHVHVTPYQINDTTRPWIGKEEALFVQKLKNLGAVIVEHKHFSRELPSLDNHFRLLESL